MYFTTALLNASRFNRRFRRSPTLMVSGAVLAATLSGCAVNENRSPLESAADSTFSGELIGVGASSQGAAQESWIAGFQSAHGRVSVNYDPAGSGAGREAFMHGGASFAGSDRPFTVEEIADGGFEMCAPGSALVELPVYVSPIVVVFNVDGVLDLNVDAPTLAGIFSGQITRWDDPDLVRQNPGAALPDLAITAVHRSDDSGTTGNFTDYLSKVAPEVWQVGATQTWPSEYGGEGAQGTSGVVETVAGGVGTIGYADASRAGDLASVSLLEGGGYVPYSPGAAAVAIDAAALESGRANTDLVVTLDPSGADSNAYPLVLVSYLIGCETYRDPQVAELVRTYFAWTVSEAGQEAAAKNAGSVPLPPRLRGALSGAAEQIGGPR